MTRDHFAKLKWGVGMVVKYDDSTEDTTTQLIADVVSVDFENFTIGVELPMVGDLIFLPCEKCNLLAPKEV